VSRIEVFDGLDFQAHRSSGFFEGGEFFECPNFIGITGEAPAGVIAHGLVAGAIAGGAKVVYEVNDQVRATALFGELEVFAVQLMPIESKSEFHFNAEAGDLFGMAQRIIGGSLLPASPPLNESGKVNGPALLKPYRCGGYRFISHG
jgi:hypothetical protein